MSILRQCGALVARQLITPQRKVLTNYIAVLPAVAKRINVKALEDEQPFGSRGHKKFGHQKEKTPNFTKFFHFVVGSLFVISVMDWKK